VFAGYCVVQVTGKSRKEECLLSPEDAEEKVGLLRKVKELPEFLANVWQEMKLVYRPGWREVRSTTLVVIVFVVLFAFYFRALDWMFSPLDRWLFVH
jgi:preprotein translocase SecE subunit